MTIRLIDASLTAILLLTVLAGLPARAQTACPVGTVPGSATCGPSVGSGGQMASPPPRPSGEWLKTWGAIATAGNGDTGVSSQEPSKAEAENLAMQRCASFGNTDCTIAMTYRNQCVAAVNPVRGGKGSTISTAATLDQALARATAKCERASGGECKAAVAGCSPPVFRRY
ncbi:DUF4189 domain-containing protein (plasmid) [Rhizobium sp. NIBRBAC000502774]|nr:DUF4189 domain-containing protein [Rhizobium sp. NIBRBAC000502774]